MCELVVRSGMRIVDSKIPVVTQDREFLKVRIVLHDYSKDYLHVQTSLRNSHAQSSRGVELDAAHRAQKLVVRGHGGLQAVVAVHVLARRDVRRLQQFNQHRQSIRHLDSVTEHRSPCEPTWAGERPQRQHWREPAAILSAGVAPRKGEAARKLDDVKNGSTKLPNSCRRAW